MLLLAASRHIARTLLLGRRETDEQVLNMFESKEEVERTMLALKIFPDMGHVGDVEQEEPDTDEEEYAPQVGRDFLILHPHMISNAKLEGIQKQLH